jgi:hypothetical protein
MALYDEFEEINLGNVVNDGTGDTLHEAFTKVKDSIAFLYANGNGPVTGQNIGATGTNIFKQKTDTFLEFRKITSTDVLKLTVVDDVITLQFDPTAPVDFKGQDIINTGIIYGDLTGTVTGLVRGDTNNEYVDVSVLNSQVNTFDYGFIAPTFIDPISYLLSEIGTDMGTFVDPNPISIDAGTI